MTTPRPSAASPILTLLVVVGTCAGLVLLVVILTGGFVIDTALFRLSSRGWRTPALLTGAAWLAAAAYGWTALGAVTGRIAELIEEHGSSLAAVVAAAAVGTAIGCGTYAASGSDASGYASFGRLIASGRLARVEPMIRQVAWPDAEWSFSPLGYRPGQTLGEVVPTYPPGLPVMMAVAGSVETDVAPYLVVPLCAGLAVLSTFWLGRRLHSSTAGVVAAALLATSPIFLFQAVQPMSDVPATAFLALALLLALTPSDAQMLAAGACAGVAVLARPELLPFAVVIVLFALRSRASGGGLPVREGSRAPARWRRLLMIGVGAAPMAAVLLGIHWRLYGSAFTSGYGGFSTLFSTSNIGPNVQMYAWRMGHGESPALLLALTMVGVRVFGARQIRWPERLTRPIVLAAGVLGAVLLSYLPYAVFTEWSYLRFLLPAFPAVFVVIGALVADAGRQLPRAAGGLVLLPALAIVCSSNVIRADAEQAFNLRLYESRYRVAGWYLDAMLPANAVIFAVQESGSASHYTSRPVVRWDQLRIDLDTAVASLRAIGRTPVLLVEDWERADLRSRFPRGSMARLDWAPRAEFGDATRVHLFDPADRGTLPEHWSTDRVH